MRSGCGVPAGAGCSAAAAGRTVRICSGALWTFFCDVVFMVFFFLLCCASSVYRPSQKAEPPAIPRGRNLRRAPRAGWLAPPATQ